MLYVGSKYPSNVTVGSREAKAVFRGSTPQWAPPWKHGEYYKADDVVRNRGSFYRCTTNHTSSFLSEPGSALDYIWLKI
ncbi:carbohydrate-binding protein [Corynebacterium striatum]|uniref:carbohydrate-binding protein n=1 Tax=Corynebacterium striatum TaxID=43770 RepID=UPI0034420C68